jgi:hypothetical protein
MKVHDYNLTCVDFSSENQYNQWIDYATQRAEFLIMMLCLHCLFTTVLISYTLYLYCNPSNRKDTCRMTFLNLVLLTLAELNTIWNESGLFHGNFRTCMKPYMTRYGLENLVLLFISMSLVLGFHRGCSTLYNFSKHGVLSWD